MRNVSFAAVAWLLLPVTAAAETQASPHQAFCMDARTTMDYDICSAAEAEHAQAALRKTLAAALEKWRDSPETVSALERAQGAWKASFEADVAARFAELDAARARGEWVGTAYVSTHNWYEAQLTRARTAQLCEFVRGDAYGERDRAPCSELVKQVLNEQKK